jgi:hypothetical protein
MTALATETCPAEAPAQVTPRVLMEDPGADHQIIIRTPDGHGITVSCTCRKPARATRGRPYYEPIESRELFPAAELWAAWADWHLTGGRT